MSDNINANDLGPLGGSLSLNYSTCRALLDEGAVGNPDSDISGPGVTSAFIVSAYLTFAAVLGSYCFGLVDAGLLRPVDRLIMHAPSRASKFPRTHVALRKAIMVTSDQQIVTGIAILAAGFNGLMNETISVYHFQIVIYLAWMSSSVHLSALTLLRPFMLHHRGVLVWRLIGMLVLLVMLIVALVPAVSNDWAVITLWDDIDAWLALNTTKTDLGIPAICFWGETYGDGVNPDAVGSFLLLFVSYAWKVGGLFASSRSAWWRYVRNPIDHMLELPLAFLAKRYTARPRRWLTLWAFRSWLVFHLNLTVILEVLDSFSAALWLSVLGLVCGTLEIIIPKALIAEYTPIIAQQEDIFTFGQLVALVLLVQPVGAIAEHLWLVGGEEEMVYERPHGQDSGSDILDLFDQKSPHLDQLRMETGVHFMSTYQVPAWKDTSPARARWKALLYTTWTLTILVWSLQAGVLAISIIILYVAYFAIGYTVSANWFLIAVGIGCYTVHTYLLGTILICFSRLGKVRLRGNRAPVVHAARNSSPENDRAMEEVSAAQFGVPSSVVVPEEKPRCAPSPELDATINYIAESKEKSQLHYVLPGS